MTAWLLSLKADGWTAIFTALGFFVILIGTIITLRNLAIIRRTHELQAFESFIDELQCCAEDRKFLFQYSFPANLTAIPPSDIQRLENVVNFLNRIGLLLEKNILPPRFVFGMTHTVIIRCCYKLRDFLQYQETRIGGRYGRRLFQLDERAKRYHDIRAVHRKTIISIFEGSRGSTVIYETAQKRGWRRSPQQALWYLKDFLNIF